MTFDETLLKNLKQNAITTATKISAEALKESESVKKLKKLNFTEEQLVEIVDLISTVSATISATLIKQFIIEVNSNTVDSLT